MPASRIDISPNKTPGTPDKTKERFYFIKHTHYFHIAIIAILEIKLSL